MRRWSGWRWRLRRRGGLVGCPVSSVGGGGGGRVLRGGGGVEGAASAMLGQAAQWLGAMMAVAWRHEQLKTLAVTDELSGAYKRRYFLHFMAGLLEQARAKRFRVTLLLFDIDDFKKYNDVF